MHRILLLSAGILAVIPVKCNSILAKRSPTADDGYEYVTVTGSNVPMRVQKGKPVITTSPVDVMGGGDSLRNYTQKNQNLGPKLGGG